MHYALTHVRGWQIPQLMYHRDQDLVLPVTISVYCTVSISARKIMAQ